MPGNVAEWNHLPATIREAHLLTLLRLDCAVLSFLVILQDNNCLVTSAGRQTRSHTTVYPI